MLRSTLVVTFFAFLSQIVAFVIQIFIAASFGAGQQMDAYLAGATMPQYLTAIITSSLAAVFIPIFITYNSKSIEDGREVVNGIVSINLFFCFALTVLGMIFSYSIIEMTVPGLTPEGKSIAYRISLILWPTVFFTSFQFLLISWHQANKFFIWSSIVPVIGAIFQLILIVIFKNHFDYFVLASITMLSVIVQTILLCRILILGKFKIQFSYKHPGVVEFLHLIFPLLVSNIFIRITPIIERFFASDLMTGSISHLNYAFKITMFISTLLTIGLSTVIFPYLSEALSNNNVRLFKQTVSTGLNSMWLLLAPIITLGIVLSLPIISFAFERGAFTHHDSIEVSKLLQIYILSLIASSLGAITGKSLYALKLTKLLSVIGIVEAVAYIFYTRFLSDALGVYGIALGYLIYFTLSFSWHVIVIIRKTRGSQANILTFSSLKIIICALVSGLTMWFLIQLFSNNLMKIMIGGTVGLLFYFVLLITFKTSEILFLKEKARVYLKNISY
jgi:putative peptidoglycan lipid II flippase